MDLKLIDEKILNKLQKSCKQDIFDIIFEYIYNIIFKYPKISFIFIFIIFYILLKKYIKYKYYNNNDQYN